MRTLSRYLVSIALGVGTLLLIYPSVCPDSGRCDTWIGTKTPEYPNIVLIGLPLTVGVVAWLAVGVLWRRRD